MVYKSKSLSNKRKGGTVLKVAIVLFVVFIYVASNQYLKKNDNKIVLEPIKIDNGKSQ